jgi:hypothetical protein
VLDLDGISIDIPCPGCGFCERATMKQIRLQDVIICGGCKANIHLSDHMPKLGRPGGKLRARSMSLRHS